MYRPTMSSSFSTNLGSRDILKRLIRWGFRPLAFQMRCTVVSLTPATSASVLVLHCVAADGWVWVVRRTISAGSILGLRPPRGKSCSDSPSANHALIAELVTCRFVVEHAPVLIAGPTGTGKSHLIQALGHCALRAGHDVLFITHHKLLAQLHAARATNTYERKLMQLAKIEVIAIDDFGLRPMRSPQDEDFHELIAERYERATTLVTSNLDFGEWGAAFPNKPMGAATLDRLRDGAYLASSGPRDPPQAQSHA